MTRRYLQIFLVIPRLTEPWWKLSILSLVRSKQNKSKERSVLNLPALSAKHQPPQQTRATRQQPAGLVSNPPMAQTQSGLDKKSALHGRPHVINATPRDTSPKPAPSVYTAVPGATKAREAENAANPEMELLMNLEPSPKPSALPS